jgi:transposase
MERKVALAMDESIARKNGHGGVASSLGQAAPAHASEGVSRPDPEVAERATRRRYSAEYKLDIVRQADECRQTGEIGALLRREGLYSSNLAKWRRQREQGSLGALAPRKRGRKPDEADARDQRLAQLERENGRLQRRLAEAELIISFQKKVASLLGVTLASQDSDEGG